MCMLSFEESMPKNLHYLDIRGFQDDGYSEPEYLELTCLFPPNHTFLCDFKSEDDGGLMDSDDSSDMSLAAKRPKLDEDNFQPSNSNNSYFT